jgi:hypothetical protein
VASGYCTEYGGHRTPLREASLGRREEVVEEPGRKTNRRPALDARRDLDGLRVLLPVHPHEELMVAPFPGPEAPGQLALRGDGGGGRLHRQPHGRLEAGRGSRPVVGSSELDLDEEALSRPKALVAVVELKLESLRRRTRPGSPPPGPRAAAPACGGDGS